MVLTNDEINVLCQQQQDLIRNVSRQSDKAKEQRLLEINEQIKNKQCIMLRDFWEEYNISKCRIEEQENTSPIAFKQAINKQYKELIDLYRDVMKLAMNISKIKKEMRTNIL